MSSRICALARVLLLADVEELAAMLPATEEATLAATAAPTMACKFTRFGEIWERFRPFRIEATLLATEEATLAATSAPTPLPAGQSTRF